MGVGVCVCVCVCVLDDNLRLTTAFALCPPSQATWRASAKRFDACRRLVASCQVQGRAIDVALDNANRHFRAVQAQFDAFMLGFDQESSAQGALIASFNADLDKLRRIELHPMIRTEGEFEALVDCVDVEYVRTAYADCCGFRESYLSKVSRGRRGREKGKRRARVTKIKARRAPPLLAAAAAAAALPRSPR